jgi:D-alanine-D-alanine ligase
MRVVILHNSVDGEASQAERDVLVQAAAVAQALRQLGHEPIQLAATLDLRTLRAELLETRPDLVFNLVESLQGCDWLNFLATGLLDSLELPYTGSPTEALVLSTHKLLAKEMLQRAGLPTPAWLDGRATRRTGNARRSTWPAVQPGARYVLKPVAQEASFGLDDHCVVTAADRADLLAQLAGQTTRLGCPCFAEAYVAGREFNVSVLDADTGPEVLPPAEIDFAAFPDGMPRIVGYRAKWDEDSFEYQHTPRRFDFPAGDRSLLDALGELSLACWDLFHLAGYVRVDFRVDAGGRPWILELNANPCLSPDAGFAAALGRAGIPFEEAVARILCSASAELTTI